MVVDGQIGDRPIKPALELWLRPRCPSRRPDPGKCFLHDVLGQLEILYLQIGKLQCRWSERLDQGFKPVAVLLLQFKLPSSLSTTTGCPECDSRLWSGLDGCTGLKAIGNDRPIKAFQRERRFRGHLFARLEPVANPPIGISTK